MVALGIDLGGTSVKIGAVEEGVVLEKARVFTRPDGDYAGIVRDIAGAALPLAEKYGAVRAGIGSCGLVDSARGAVCFSNNVGWENVPLAEDVGRLLSLPVHIANDAKCAALGEALYGAGRGYGRVLMLTLGTGVGGGFIEDGKLTGQGIYGDAAGIYGHITLEKGGRKCTCGRRGCFEAYCSATALSRRGSEVCGRKVSAEELFSLARSGDERAAGAVREFEEFLAAGTVSLVNALRPEIAVFGGGVSASADLFLPAVNRALEREAYGYAYAPVRAAAAILGNDAGIVGAAALQ